MKNRLFIGSVIFLLLAVLPVAAKSKEEKGLAALSVKENVFVDESGRVVRQVLVFRIRINWKKKVIGILSILKKLKNGAVM